MRPVRAQFCGHVTDPHQACHPPPLSTPSPCCLSAIFMACGEKNFWPRAHFIIVRESTVPPKSSCSVLCVGSFKVPAGGGKTRRMRHKCHNTDAAAHCKGIKRSRQWDRARFSLSLSLFICLSLSFFLLHSLLPFFPSLFPLLPSLLSSFFYLLLLLPFSITSLPFNSITKLNTRTAHTASSACHTRA